MSHITQCDCGATHEGKWAGIHTQGCAMISTTPTIYFVKCSFGKIGDAWIERDVNETDRKSIVADLIALQIENPLQIIEVDVKDGTSRDVTEDIAREIADWSGAKCEPLHQSLIDFVHDHAGSQLARELKAA